MSTTETLKKYLNLLLIVCGGSALAWTLYQGILAPEQFIATRNAYIIGVTSVCSIIFIFLRSVAWKLSCTISTLPITFTEALKTTYISTLVDFLTFPSRITADAYRFSSLHGEKDAQKLLACSLYRVTTSLPYIIAFIALGYSSTFFFALLIACVAMCFAINALRIKITKYIKDWGAHLNLSSAVAVLIIVNSLPALIDALRIAVILYGVNPNIETPLIIIAAKILSANLMSAATGVPLGLGSREALYYSLLPLDIHQVLELSVVSRLTGECFSALIGWIIVTRKKYIS